MKQSGEPIAVVTEASKSYPGVRALVNVSFSVDRGEVRALLGKNGAGKSTLIRLLSGAEAPDSGTVCLSGRVLEHPSVQKAQQLGVRTVYQELSLIPQLSVAENLFMGRWPKKLAQIDRRSMAEQTRVALARLDLAIDPNRPVEELSIADQQLVEIARAIHDRPSLLILDEPTSSLAAAEVDQVLQAVAAIRESGVSVIYVSHRLDEIRRVADTATIMRDGEVVDTVSVQGVSTADVVHMMLGDAEAEAPQIAAPSQAGRVVAKVEGLRIAPKIDDVSFEVHAGEVLGIAGVLGSGRTEILQAMAGLRKADAGSVTVNQRRTDGTGLRRALKAGVGLTPENRKEHGIIPELGIDENTVLTDWRAVAHAGVVDRGRVREATRRVISMMSVKAASTRTVIGTLSGGNQQKVVIGRWLHAGSNVLLLDEPTRGVDVEAKAQIYQLLRGLAANGTAVVFVSSELEELNQVCDRVVVLNDGRISASYEAPNINVDKLLVSAIAKS